MDRRVSHTRKAIKIIITIQHILRVQSMFGVGNGRFGDKISATRDILPVIALAGAGCRGNKQSKNIFLFLSLNLSSCHALNNF